MCSPAAFAIAATVVSTAYTGIAQHAQSQYQEAIQNHNAQVSEYQAEDAAKRGGFAAEQQANKVNQIEGAQRAAIGASGIQSDTGTVGEVLGQTAKYGALDEAQIRSNALREAWGYRQQGENYRMQGELDRASGDNMAAGSILNGMTKAFGMYSTLPQDPNSDNPWKKVWT